MISNAEGNSVHLLHPSRDTYIQWSQQTVLTGDHWHGLNRKWENDNVVQSGRERDALNLFRFDKMSVDCVGTHVQARAEDIPSQNRRDG